MRTYNRIKRQILAAVMTAGFITTIPSAQAASVNVVHGIDGRSLGADRALPVDIAVNGTCSLKGVTFTQSALVDLKSGTYRVTVHLAGRNCSNAPVITENVMISDRSYSLVASLSRTGSPRLAVFNNSKDLGFTPVVSTRHLAAAGAVTVEYRSPGLTKPDTRRISNGRFSSFGILAPSFKYSGLVFAGSRRNSLAKLTGTARRRYVIYNIVGSADVGFTVISETLAP
jgi:hypothetical protein